MPIHDWSRVESGIFHAFHQQWLIAISNALNSGILPRDYYALPEQFAAGFGPDVLTLQVESGREEDEPQAEKRNGGIGLLLAKPKIEATAETDAEYYRRKQNSIAIRHVSGDRIVAMIEIVSPGNKSSRHGIHSFLSKAAELLDKGLHLLIIDLLPPGPRDPHGIHSAIWDEIAGKEYIPPSDKPLTLAPYEKDLAIRAYVEPVAVGDSLPEMPLFLKPNGCVHVPIESTYNTAFGFMPERWRKVLESK